MSIKPVVSSYFLNEGRSWFDDPLALDPTPTLARIDAPWVNGWLALIWHRYYALTALSIEVWRQGNPRWAVTLAQESLALNQALDDQLGIALNLVEVLSLAATDDQQYQRAARLLGAQDSLHQPLGVSLRTYTHLATDRGPPKANIEHIRIELGITSRAQIVAWVAEQASSG